MAKVTPSEMIRLNTAIAPTPRASQSTFGVAGDDLAGFPNGRRPGDDAVDLTLRVAMGRLCYPVPINHVQTDLGLCKPADASTGNAAYTDGAPISARDLQATFPYLNTPIPGLAAHRAQRRRRPTRTAVRMTPMRKSVRNLLLVTALPLGLAACGGSGDASLAAASGSTATAFDRKFGDSFASFFETSPTTTDANVKHPTTADVPPLSLTTEPIDN